MTYAALGLSGRLLPTRAWLPLCAALARLQTRLAPLSAERRRHFQTRLEHAGSDIGAQDLRRERLRLSYHEIMLLLGHRRAAPGLHAELYGRERLDEALALGRGAIVWVCPSVYASVLAKMALSRAGYRVSHLSRHYHGSPSESVFGERLFARRWAAVENRYLGERLVMTPHNQVGPLKTLTRRLRQNQVVSITATGGQRALQADCLGGRIELGQGAPRLAVSTGAALLPAFLTPLAADRYRLSLTPPLQAPEGPQAERERLLAQQYAARLEDFLRQRPALWDGWSEWQPRPCRG